MISPTCSARPSGSLALAPPLSSDAGERTGAAGRNEIRAAADMIDAACARIAESVRRGDRVDDVDELLSLSPSDLIGIEAGPVDRHHHHARQHASRRDAERSNEAPTSYSKMRQQEGTLGDPRRRASMLAPGPRKPTGGEWHLPAVGAEPLLFHAARHGHDQVVQILLDRFGARIPNVAPHSWRPVSLLHLACWSGNARTVDILLSASERLSGPPLMVDELGADGETPLHVALVIGHPGLVVTLLEHGASIACPLTLHDKNHPKFLTTEAKYKRDRQLPLKSRYTDLRDFVQDRIPRMTHLLPATVAAPAVDDRQPGESTQG